MAEPLENIIFETGKLKSEREDEKSEEKSDKLSLDLLIRATVLSSIPPRHLIKGPEIEVTRPGLIKKWLLI